VFGFGPAVGDATEQAVQVEIDWPGSPSQSQAWKDLPVGRYRTLERAAAKP